MNENQLDLAAVRGMKLEDILAAQDSGKLARLMGASERSIEVLERVQSGIQLGLADVQQLTKQGSYDLICELEDQGRFNELKGIK